MSEEMNNTKKIAVVKDGVVLEIMHTDERMTAIFLDNPTFIDVTLENDMCRTYKGDTYDSATGKFDLENKINFVNFMGDE
jgi:hypothetical protein